MVLRNVLWQKARKACSAACFHKDSKEERTERNLRKFLISSKFDYWQLIQKFCSEQEIVLYLFCSEYSESSFVLHLN